MKAESPDYSQEIFLISAPRSANTITRYILEHLTGYTSYGYIGSGGHAGVDNGSVAKNVKNCNATGVIFKRHGWEPWRYLFKKEAPDKRVITIIRNPLDWRSRGIEFPDTWKTLDSRLIDSALSYKDHPSKIIFFESLMSDPEGCVRELAEFINSPVDRLEDFIKDIDTHMSGKKAPEQNKPNQVEPNVRKLPADERLREWEKLMSTFSETSQVFFNHHYPGGLWANKS